jgi:serine/threonine protein phosphatase PrpC
MLSVVPKSAELDVELPLIEVASKSITGSAHPYEDRVLVDESKGLFAVADGVTYSSQGSGAFAAELALKLLKENFSGDLLQAIHELHQYIARRKTMDQRIGETTLTAASLKEEWLEVANVGDSPAYLVRGGVMQSLARKDEGPLGGITQVIGYPEIISVHTERVQLEQGDCAIIASDGVEHILHPQIIVPLVAALHASKIVDAIINEAESTEAGYDDDKSVIVLVRE